MSDQVCGAEVELQGGVLAVLRATPADLPTAAPGEIVDPLRCVLQSRHGGKHHGIARGLPLRYLGEVWGAWASGQQPCALLVLSDCPVRDPHDPDEACVLFNGHAGAHSWGITDPGEDAVRERLELVPAQPTALLTDTAATSPPQPRTCDHRRIEKRGGKTYCTRCRRQIYC